MKFTIEIEVDEQTEEITYKFKSHDGPIKLRDFVYWTMEGITGIMAEWEEDE